MRCRSKHFPVATFFRSIAYDGDVDGSSFPWQDLSQEMPQRQRALTAHTLRLLSEFPNAFSS
jgi:hypothetical protein